ncbi:DoxX family protein [Candidatus Poribacteria bacterium]|nr:DoxX family protein [Candidatus Poribacteria bacterium]
METVKTNRKNLVTLSVSVLLALVFLGSGGSKLAGVRMHIENFARWGYPNWFMYVTGLVEVAGAALVLVPATRFYGAALLVCTMLGAIVTHLKAGELAMLPPPFVLLVLAGLVAWVRRPKGAGQSTTRSE